MEAEAEKRLVLKAGLELVEKGLIARTWGNVSCRVDAETFVITPSGRSYDRLTPGEIVLCKTADASYTGEIKPSSERGIHALIYRTRPDVNFVIHTHQTQASAVSVFGRKTIPTPDFPELGGEVPVADYGLPGTKKLREGVGRAMKSADCAIIMAHHGVVCFGKDDENAFHSALTLENACRAYIEKLYREQSGEKAFSEGGFYSLFCRNARAGGPALTDAGRVPASSRRSENGFVFQSDAGETAYTTGQEGLPGEARIHAAIYQSRSDVNFIVGSAAAPLWAAASAGVSLRPLLDDFAQLVGRYARCCTGEASPQEVANALGNRAGVLVPGYGALCCAGTLSDAQAVRLVMEKDAYAQVADSFAESGRQLSLLDCALMHAVYQMSYSKQNKK